MNNSMLIELAETWDLQAATGGDGLNDIQPPAREMLRACADTLRMLVQAASLPVPAWTEAEVTAAFLPGRKDNTLCDRACIVTGACSGNCINNPPRSESSEPAAQPAGEPAGEPAPLQAAAQPELLLRLMAIERARCAQACESIRGDRFAEHGTREPDTGACYYGGRVGEEYETRDEEDEACAAAIRALKDRTPEQLGALLKWIGVNPAKPETAATPPTGESTTPAAEWRPMETAPTDGTAVLLLIEGGEHPLQDETPSVSIGSYGVEGGPEEDPTWNFAGWSWHQDCYCRGIGTPIGWLPRPPTDIATPTAAAPVALPDMSFDPDGELSLDWSNDGGILSISVGPQGRLSCAADVPGWHGSATWHLTGQTSVHLLFDALKHFHSTTAAAPTEPTSAQPVVTRSSAVTALHHLSRHNGPGRFNEAIALLTVAAQPAAAGEVPPLPPLNSDTLWQLAQDECNAFECDDDGCCDEDGMHFRNRAALLRFAVLVIDRTDAERASTTTPQAQQPQAGDTA